MAKAFSFGHITVRKFQGTYFEVLPIGYIIDGINIYESSQVDQAQ